MGTRAERIYKNPTWLLKYGKEHPRYVENPSYNAIHNYVRSRLEKPDACLHCHQKKPLELANISQEYKRDLRDWMYLCKSCHRKYDRNDKCNKGHELTNENSYIASEGYRICRQCRAAYSREYKKRFKARIANDPIKYLGEHI